MFNLLAFRPRYGPAINDQIFVADRPPLEEALEDFPGSGRVSRLHREPSSMAIFWLAIRSDILRSASATPGDAASCWWSVKKIRCALGKSQTVQPQRFYRLSGRLRRSLSQHIECLEGRDGRL